MNTLKHICLYFILFIAFSCGDNNKHQIAAWVNDEPISEAELKHWMLLEKANVFNYFYQKYNMPDSDDFWTQKLDDEIPLTMLKIVALEKAKRCKTQQLLALKKGIIKTANFHEIISQLGSINAARKKKMENGEAVYGPVQFTTRTYFFSVYDKMLIDLKNELAKEELKLDSEDLINLQKDFDPEEKDNLGFLTMQYVDDNYDLYIDELMSKMDMKINNANYEKVGLD